MTNKAKKKNAPDYLVKMGFVIIGVIVVLAVIIGQYIWDLMFDPEHFDVNKWATKAILNGSISLIMMVLGFITIDESCKSRESGRFAKRKEDFNNEVTDLYATGIIVYFDPFIAWYAEKQVRQKRIRHLTKHGMPLADAELIVDYATLEDLSKISGLNPGDKPTGGYGQDIVKKDKNGKEILLPAIKDTLVAYAEEALNGSITVDIEDASYYTSADKNDKQDLTSLERAQATERERVKSLRWSFISKVAIGLIYVTIFAFLAVDKNKEIGQAEAIWNLVFRLLAATLGFIGGGFNGFNDARFSYKWLGDKMKVVREYKQCLETNEFKPKTAAQSIEERIKAVKARESQRLKEVVSAAKAQEEETPQVPAVIPAPEGEPLKLAEEGVH